MRDDLSLVPPLRVDENPHNEKEDKEAARYRPAKKVVVVVSYPQYAAHELWRVNVVAEFEISSPLAQAWKNSINGGLIHGELKVDVGSDDGSR